MGYRTGYLGEKAAVTEAQSFCDSTSSADCETAGIGDALSCGVDDGAIDVEWMGAALAVELVLAESAVDGCPTVRPTSVLSAGAESAGVPLFGARGTSSLLPDTGHVVAHRVVGTRGKERSMGDRGLCAGSGWGMGMWRDRRGWDVAARDGGACHHPLEATG